MQVRKLQQIVLLASVCFILASCKAQDQALTGDWTKFYGTFTGTSENVMVGELGERELSVVVEPWEDKGFTVEWSTVIHRADGDKEVDMSINFYASERPGIFASAMTTDVFGQSVPFDPVGLDAAPYVWAGIENNTLTVSALYIIENGGYETQVYRRTLNEKGLMLEFERLKNGEKASEIFAQLEPAK